MIAPLPSDKPSHPTDDKDIRTVEQLRHAIDSGRTGDKTAASDPAAAPLGTDDEAAGTPATPEQVATAAEHETARPTSGGDYSGKGPLWALIAAAVVLAGLFLAVPLLR